MQDILAGGAEKCEEAGAVLAGGHSIYDDGIKYGLAVTGMAELDKFYRNDTPRVGHKLILTKPLGIGVITAADRDGEADASDSAEAIKSMERLNKYAAEKAGSYDISACTDITGFGLIAHTLEMTAGNVSAEINCDSLPHLKRVRHFIEDEWITGGGQRNRKFVGARVDTSALPLWVAELMFDPQTSGGLLIAVDSTQVDDLIRDIQDAGDTQAAIIGSIVKRDNDEIAFI